MARVLQARPLTPDAFAPFGDVIDARAASPLAINGGSTHRFNDLARVQIDPAGRPLISLFRNLVTIDLPYRLPLLECHPLGSQAFVPQRPARFLVVVARPGPAPDPDQLSAFLTDGIQGVNYHAGTWHLPLAGLTLADYLVIDRGGPGNNCREYPLDAEPVIVTHGPG
jgi:ureidoglycolate lyase